MTVQITGLFYYPVKSCRGLSADAVTLDALGIRHDRRFLAVRAADSMFLTQREHPRMAQILPAITDSTLTLSAPGMAPLSVPLSLSLNDAPQVHVTIWKDFVTAADAGESAAAWLTAFLGFPCRLVQAPPDFERPVDSRYARPGDRVHFGDAFPLLLASEASLADLNARLAAAGADPVPMTRFRPNIVVAGDGLAPFAEDGWRVLRVRRTGATFRVAKPCARCAITTLDPETGAARGPEPLRTLAAYRRTEDGKVLFAQNVLPDWQGEPLDLRIGDRLDILEPEEESP